MPSSVTALFSGKDRVKLPKLKNDIEDHPRYSNYEHRSLEDLLDELVKYGQHRLSWMGNGWYCSLDFYVNVVGAKLEVASEFKNQTHKKAVIECMIRLHDTIEQINQTRNAR